MLISRMFRTAEDASRAASALTEAGFSGGSIHTFSAGTVTNNVAEVTALGVAPKAAETYLARVAVGETLLVMDVPFGWGASALAILGDDAIEASPLAYEGVPKDPATPLSSAFDIPVLSHNPTPLSSWLNVPTLSADQRAKSSWFGWPMLLHKAAPFSNWINMKLLLDEPAPLSQKTGARILTDDPAPLSRLAKLQLLWSKATPLSDKIGMSALSHEPAPLSKLLGLPVLCKSRASRP
jgi:hypothetical protein